MSRIQQALDKNRDQAIEQPASASRSDGHDLLDRDSSREIARMAEPSPWSRRELEARGLIDFSGSNQRAANAFRQMRAGLVQRAGGSNFIMAVTATSAAGGSSFIARNIASAFALDQSKTSILVDGNLASPTVHSLVAGPAGSAGLTEYLLDESMMPDAILRPTGVPRMRVIPAGTLRDRSGEIFAQPRLARLFDHIEQRYPERFVIVDAPPILDAADARMLCQVCDCTLLVVPYGGVSPGRVNEAIEAVGDGRLIGTVFNDDPVVPV